MAERKVGLGGSFQHVPGALGSSPQYEAPQQSRPQLPGGNQSLPLPIGEPVPIDPTHLTPKERQDLETIGWKPGMAIPANLADWIDKAKQAATDPQHMPPPADPRTPPLKVPDQVDLKDLPEAKRRELEQMLQQTQLQQQARRQEADTTPVQPGQGVMEAIRVAGGEGRELQLEDDVPRQMPDLSRPKSQRAPQTKPPEPAAAPPPEPKPEPRAETSSNQPAVCPNCSWNLEFKEPVEITDLDKQDFLAATLGGVPFKKLFTVLGGQLQIIIRTLKPYEVDACYRQGYADRKANEVATATDFLEQVNRYRMCLQLSEIRSGENLSQFPEDLHDWGGPGDFTLLPNILQKVQNEELASESLIRIVTHLLHKFNHVVGRLEANIDNADFWKAVAPTN